MLFKHLGKRFDHLVTFICWIHFYTQPINATAPTLVILRLDRSILRRLTSQRMAIFRSSRKMTVGGKVRAKKGCIQQNQNVAFALLLSKCSIPDGRINPRRRALFVACSILGEVRDGGRACRSLHKQATTTPKVRAAIQASDEPAWVLAERYGISEQTVWKWRKRDSVHDRSHTPQKLQTTLTPAQEAVAVSLRRTLLLPLNDLLALVRKFLNRMSRTRGSTAACAGTACPNCQT